MNHGSLCMMVGDPTDIVESFNFLLELNLEQCCPTKTIKSTNLDGKIRSVAVDQACRRKNREYIKHGNSAKFKKLKKEAEATLKKTTSNFLSKQIELVGAKNNSWLRHVKAIAARPG